MADQVPASTSPDSRVTVPAEIPTTMRAARITGPDGIEVVEMPLGRPGPGEALLKMRWSSVCGSDLHMIYDGINLPEAVGTPGWPGHEGVGVVLDGDLTDALPGVEIGAQVLAVPFGAGGGCFADYQIIPTAQLLALPDGDPRHLLLGQQLGTTIWALRSYWPSPEPPAVATVLGAGSAGLFFTQLLKRKGVGTVIVSEPNDDRRALAATVGADHVTTPGDVLDLVSDLTSGSGCDLTIEAAGFSASRAQAVRMTRFTGRIGCFGYPETAAPEPFPVWEAFRKSHQVSFTIGAQAEPGRHSLAEALRLIADGSIDVSFCVGAEFPLEDLAAGLAAARAQDCVKATIVTD